MKSEEVGRRLKWLLALVSLVGGVVWILAAFDVVMGGEELNTLYLALGVVLLLGSAGWFFSLRQSQGNADRQAGPQAE